MTKETLKNVIKIEGNVAKAVNGLVLSEAIASLFGYAHSIYKSIQTRLGKTVNSTDEEVKKYAAVGVSFGAKVTAAIGKIIPKGVYSIAWNEIGTRGLSALVAGIFAAIPFFGKKSSDENQISYLKSGIKFAISITTSLVTIAGAYFGFGSLETGLSALASAVVGTAGGAAIASQLPKFAREDKNFTKKITSGLGWGSIAGGAIGGLVGSFFGLASEGAVIGASVGSLVGGGAVVVTPSIAEFIKKFPVINDFFHSKDMKLATKVTISVASGLGFVIAGPAGALAFAAVGLVAVFCTYVVYKNIKKIVDVYKEAVEKEIAAENKAEELFATQAKTPVATCTLIGTAIGAIFGGPLGAAIGAAVGGLVGLSWTVLRRVTANTIVAKAIDKIFDAPSKVISNLGSIIKDKIVNIFAPIPEPVPQEIKIQDLSVITNSKSVDLVQNEVTSAVAIESKIEEVVEPIAVKSVYGSFFKKSASTDEVTEFIDIQDHRVASLIS